MKADTLNANKDSGSKPSAAIVAVAPEETKGEVLEMDKLVSIANEIENISTEKLAHERIKSLMAKSALNHFELGAT